LVVLVPVRLLSMLNRTASDDDGFEFFGGSVNTRYLVAAFNALTMPSTGILGFRGKHQFWFGIQGTDEAGRVAEMDGATGTEQGTPYAKPIVANVTYLGGGVANEVPVGDGAQLLMFRDNTGGNYWNSIFGDFNATAGNIAISVEKKDDDGIEDSENRMLAGDLALVNNIWFDFGAGSGLADIAPQDFVQTHLGDNGNSIENPLLKGISRAKDGGLDPRPGAGSPALTGAASIDDDYFMPTDYRGAFGTVNWLRGWTALDHLGYVDQGQEITITDSDIPVGSNVTFESGNTYILDGIVFVDSAATLTIEPGTIIKAEDGVDTDATALVVHRYGMIYAEGTADAPIIFTSVLDDLDDPEDLDYTDRGLWGGVVMLGQAITNNSEQQSIEGVNEIDPVRSLYGGDNDEHSSGVFRYVSIRHTGINIGSTTGNEIQGLTVGGVGSGTVIEYVESFASDDDGFEFFGGSVNTRYLVSAFNSDDSFDWDSGFRGKHQFWFAIQGTDEAGRVAEMDGATGTEQGTPYAKPIVANVTYLGGGVANEVPVGDGAQLLMFRDNTGGNYWNSIFGDFNATAGNIAITVEKKDDDGIEDSENRMLAGDLALVNNIWFDFGAGSGLADIAPQDFVQTHLAANGNTIEDPLLMGISREFDGMLDPRPSAGSPALTGAASIDDEYFMATAYRGAFDPNAELWTAGWTALDQLNYTSYTSVDEEGAQGLATSFALKQNYPNPFNPTTTIEYTMAAAGKVNLTVYNIMGQKVAELVSGVKAQGTHKLTFDATNLSSGVYFYQLQAGSTVMTKRMTLIK
jgi:hypothetical protein